MLRGASAFFDDIGVVELDETDVVRHSLVAKIIRAYANPLPQ